MVEKKQFNSILMVRNNAYHIDRKLPNSLPKL